MKDKYINPLGKERQAYPPEITVVESSNRKEYFFQVLEPAIVKSFQKRGVKEVMVELVGSVASGQAGPDSDIDCLLSRKGLIKLFDVEG